MDIIYCGTGGNKRFAEIAISNGMMYGFRSTCKPLRKADFVDVDYRRPNLKKHLERVQQSNPKYAVAPDIMRLDDFEKIMKYAEELQVYAEYVIIVPKVCGLIPFIPDNFIIGYPVCTQYGATDVPIWEIGTRRVHILGGSPHRQIDLSRYLVGTQSADGNAIEKACQKGKYWNNGWKHYGVASNFMYKCFELSVINIIKAWNSTASA